MYFLVPAAAGEHLLLNFFIFSHSHILSIRIYPGSANAGGTGNYFRGFNGADQDGIIDLDGQVFTQTNAGIPWYGAKRLLVSGFD